MQKPIRNRCALTGEHSNRRCIHHTDRRANRVLNVVDGDGFSVGAQKQRKPIGLGSVGIEYSDLGDTKLRQRKCDRLANATCSDQGNGTLPRTLDQIACSPCKTRGVRIVTDQPVIADHDGVDRAHGRCTRR